MRVFAVWTGFVLGLSACGSDPEPSASGVSTSGVGGGVPAAGTGPGIAAGPAGNGAVRAGNGAGPAGMQAPLPIVAGAGAAGRMAMPAAGSGSLGVAGTAGRAGEAGARAGAAGSMMVAGAGGRAGAGAAGAAGGGAATTEKFSFFVTSLSGMRDLSKSENGFGGNFTFGEPTGLAGADKICTTLAEKSMPGSGAKGWRAFLSTAKGGMNDGPVHAKDRIGTGPWYDRQGRVVAMTLPALLMDRPMGADAAIRNDLPNERGEPNHTDTMPGADDNHDTVTGSNNMGMFDSANPNTCGDWTSTANMSGGKGPLVGHSWPSNVSGTNWMRAHNAPGCAPSVSLVQMGGGMGGGIGNAGGYGGIYCFALQP